MRLSSLSPSSAISPQPSNSSLQPTQQTAPSLNPSNPDSFQRQCNVSFTGKKEQDSANQRLYRAVKDGEFFTARNLMNPAIRDHADVNGLLRNKQKEYQYSLLTRSVEKGDQNAIRLLKQLGVDPEQRDGMGRTPLTYAAELGKADIIDLLIDELGADLTKTNAPGYNPLTMASLQGHAEAIQHLLDRPKAKELDLANTTDDLGWTPLTVASRMNHTGVIETLHKHGVNLKKPTAQGLTALKTAKKYNHTQTVQLLEKLIHEEKTELPQISELSAQNPTDPRVNFPVQVELPVNDPQPTLVTNRPIQPKPFKNSAGRVGSIITQQTGFSSSASPQSMFDRHVVNIPKEVRQATYFQEEGASGDRPLIDAAVRGNLNQVKSLLESNPSLLNEINSEGDTALHWAASLGNHQVLQYLIQKPGIKVNLPNHDGHTPLMLAANEGQTMAVASLLQHKDIKINQIDVRNPNSADPSVNEGATAFLFACRGGHLGIVNLLLARPELNLIHKSRLPENVTPLMLATMHNHASVVKALLGRKEVQQQLNDRDNRDHSALMYAAEENHFTPAKELLSQKGIEINQPDIFRDSPLIVAAENGSQLVLNQLLATPGIQVNEQGSDCKTALMRAAENGHDACVEQLLTTPGIDATISTRQKKGFFQKEDEFKAGGETALTLAAKGAPPKIMQQLLETPLAESKYLNHRNEDGNMALHIAAMHDNQAAIRLLLQAGAKPKLKNKQYGIGNGQTPAQVALQHGHIDAQKLIEDFISAQ